MAQLSTIKLICFSQQYGLDYDETFCPVVRFESLHTIIAIAVQNNLHLHQIDFTSAFLNGNLKESLHETA